MTMTLINVSVKDDEKKKLQEFVENNTDNSLSEFVRNLISERMKMEEMANKIPDPVDVIIPEYIPNNKYVVFVNGAVVGVGDNPSELATLAMKKFPDYPFVMKFKGKPKAPMEYVFMSLSDWHAWKYAVFLDHSYPMLLITAETGVSGEKRDLNATIDTGASVCLLKTGLFPIKKLKQTRIQSISTATGIVEAPLYSLQIHILDATFEIECMLSPISDDFPFNFLIGRNLFDQLDAYFLGKKQILMFKMAS